MELNLALSLLRTSSFLDCGCSRKQSSGPLGPAHAARHTGTRSLVWGNTCPGRPAPTHDDTPFVGQALPRQPPACLSLSGWPSTPRAACWEVSIWEWGWDAGHGGPRRLQGLLTCPPSRGPEIKGFFVFCFFS